MATANPTLVVGSHFSTNTAVNVLLGNGNGEHSRPATHSRPESAPSSITVADLNGDGKADLAVGNSNATTISVLIGNGNGNRLLPSKRQDFHRSPQHITAADLDGDAVPDLIALPLNFNSVGVLLNRSVLPTVLSINRTSPAGNVVSGTSATFTVTFNKPVTGVIGGDFPVLTTGGVSFTGTTFTPVSGTVYTMTANGISGTGTLGLALGDNGTIRDLAGQPLAGGVPSFSSQQTFALTYPTSVVTADVSGDGKADVVATRTAAGGVGSVGVLLGNGNGTLQPARTFAAGVRLTGSPWPTSMEMGSPTWSWRTTETISMHIRERPAP